MHGDVSTRPERLPDDGDFLLSVYAYPAGTDRARLAPQTAGCVYPHAVRRPDPPLPGILARRHLLGHQRRRGAGRTAHRQLRRRPDPHHRHRAPAGVPPHRYRERTGQAAAGSGMPTVCRSDATSCTTAPPASSGNMPGSPPRAATGCTWPWNEHPRPGHPDRGMLRDLPIPPRINRMRPTSGSTAPGSRRTAAELPLALS